jgi:hypothetical protein
MSFNFNNELKDFIGAAKAGRDLMDNSQSNERNARADYYRSTTRARDQLMDFQKQANDRATQAIEDNTTGLTNEASQTGARVRSGKYNLTPEDVTAVNKVSAEAGISPRDLLAIISYETAGTFSPNIKGGKGGQYAGLIQFSPDNQKRYGVGPGMTFQDQLTQSVQYLKDRGLKPGMGLPEMYSMINAGSLRPDGLPRLGASDGNGTVGSHIERIRKEHYPAADRYLGQKQSALPIEGEESAQFAAEGGMVQRRGGASLYDRQKSFREAVRETREHNGYISSAQTQRDNEEEGGHYEEVNAFDPKGPPGLQDKKDPRGQDAPKRFAEGGMVERDDRMEPLARDDTEDDVPQEALPTDMSSQSRPRAPAAGPANLLEAGHKAVKDALMFVAGRAGLTQRAAVADPSRSANARAYLSGQGAAPRADMQVVLQAVDPEGKMSESERNLAAFGSVYNYYVARDPAKAQAAAGAMLQYYRLASARYNAIAQAHAQSGDIDGTVANLARAYANIPNGQDVQFQKNQDGTFSYSFVDDSGKTISKGIATPQQIAGLAMKMGPADFDKWILDAAGKRATAQAAPQGPSKAFADATGALDRSQYAIPGSPAMAEAAPSAAPAVAATAPAPVTSGGNDTPVDQVDEEEDDDERDDAAIPTNAAAVQFKAPPTPAPAFDTAKYAEMDSKEQNAYFKAHKAQLDKWKAEQQVTARTLAAEQKAKSAAAKAAAGGKPPSPRDVKAVGEMIGAAWEEHIGDNTPEAGEAPKVEKKLARTVQTSANHIFVDKTNRANSITPREAVDVAARLSLATANDPAAAGQIQTKPAEGGKLVRLTPTSRPVFIPDAEFDTLMAQATERMEKIKKAKAEASKPGFVRGAINAVQEGLARGRPTQALPEPAPEKSRYQPMPIVKPWNSVPQDQIPDEAFGGQRGLGER